LISFRDFELIFLFFFKYNLEPPSKPGTPEAVEVTDDSITLFWKAPDDDGNSEIIEYIIEYQETKEKTWRKITKITDTTYKLTELKKDTELRFRVTAVNEIGSSVPSDTFTAKIQKPVKKEPPTFTEPLKETIVGLNKPLTLSCVVGGVPIPEVTWYKDDKPFASKSVTYESRNAKYTIESTTETTAGVYKCHAINEMGESSTTCTVLVQEKPTIVIDEKLIAQNLRVSSTYEVEATVYGYPAPKIQWFKESLKLESNNEYTIETTENKSKFIIKSIERHHSGKFSIKAKNSAGVAVVDLSVSVIDKPSRPEGPLLAREISDEAVVLEWKAPGDDGGLDIQQYSIEKCDPNQKAWIKIADVDKNIESYCIQNLIENAQYLFRVIAKNPIGSSEPLESEPVTVKRVAEPPSPPRGPIEISGMTDTSFTLTWKPSEKDGGSRIIEYIVEIRESNKKVWRMLNITAFDQTSIFVQKLVKDQGYHFRITARNKLGTSEPLITDEKIIAGRQISEYIVQLFVHISMSYLSINSFPFQQKNKLFSLYHLT
jgi:Fibronectin type III domain/Immunoglobulin I-set domain